MCLLLQDLVQRCLHGGGGDMGGHVLRETTSRGLCGLVCPSRTGGAHTTPTYLFFLKTIKKKHFDRVRGRRVAHLPFLGFAAAPHRLHWATVGPYLVRALTLCAAMTAGCAADGSPPALLTADQARYVPTAPAARSTVCRCCERWPPQV